MIYTEQSEKALSTFTDPRDGKTYRTVTIGGNEWMAENLNYEEPRWKNWDLEGHGQWFYDDDPKNGAKYGLLYDWHSAMGICPAGWRLPNDKDWAALVEAAGGKEIAGRMLKSKTDWDGDGNGEDAFGFSALPGGHGQYIKEFRDIGRSGEWWSATKDHGDIVYYWSMDSETDKVFNLRTIRGAKMSVRCVRKQRPDEK